MTKPYYSSQYMVVEMRHLTKILRQFKWTQQKKIDTLHEILTLFLSITYYHI